jgi:hypothetical protein
MHNVSRSWAPSEEAKLRELYPTTSVRDLATVFQRSPEAVKSRATKLRIPKAKQRKVWTSADEWMLRALYPHISNVTLSRRLCCTIAALYRRAHQFGLHKSQIYLDSPDACRLRRGDNVGAAYRFHKGQTPPNKGLRRPGWSIGRGRMRETQFKKGMVSRNAMPMWSFRWCDGYLMLKTGAPTPKPTTGWEYVHKLIWEQAKGPLPHWTIARLWWRDGDHANCSLSNLELVTAAEHMRRTTIHNFPAPLRQVIQLKGALKRRIGRMEKENAEEHDERSTQPPV